MAHFDKIELFVDDNFPKSDYDIFTVALNDAGANYWPRSRERWEAITGPDRSNKVSNNDDVGILFRDILLELTRSFGTDSEFVDEELVLVRL